MDTYERNNMTWVGLKIDERSNISFSCGRLNVFDRENDIINSMGASYVYIVFRQTQAKVEINTVLSKNRMNRIWPKTLIFIGKPVNKPWVLGVPQFQSSRQNQQEVGFNQ